MTIQGIQGSIPFPTAAAKLAYAGGVRSIEPPTAARKLEGSTERLQNLVAGQVSSPINQGRGFDEIVNEPARVDQANLPLYNRSADHVEAATGIALGRSLDVTG